MNNHSQRPFFRILSAPRQWLLISVFSTLLVGCVVPPTAPTGPSPDEVAKQQRVERANTNFAEGLKLYENGSYDDAIKNFLLALDSGALTSAQQLASRKHMAFIYCVSNREANCREEFEKSLVIDAKFDLSPAEAGHPVWGPVFRNVKSDLEAKRAGRSIFSPAVKTPTAGEKLLVEAMTAYDAADYVKSVKVFQDALKEVLPPDEQVKARKFTAFSYCLSNRMTLCQQEFEKILQSKPDFELAAAEAGHPSWGPSFRRAKARVKQPPAKPSSSALPAAAASPAVPPKK